MSSATGATPPLHRRFNERESISYIRNRYHICREKIAKQVEALQQDAAFREKCQGYYQRGYKDWVIASAIFNCMLNWRMRELGLVRTEDQQRFPELQNMLRDVVYPTSRFLGEDMDSHIQIHCVTALNTYGFELRRRDFKPDVVEKFLRERMRHFDFDLPHSPLFGEPPGNWPRT
jgi:hypothetical protein